MGINSFFALHDPGERSGREQNLFIGPSKLPGEGEIKSYLYEVQLENMELETSHPSSGRMLIRARGLQDKIGKYSKERQKYRSDLPADRHPAVIGCRARNDIRSRCRAVAVLKFHIKA